MKTLRPLRWLLCAALLVCLTACPTRARAGGAGAPRVVRIGIAEVNGFYKRLDDGRGEGIGYEMLREISMYTGIAFEPVVAPFPKRLQMLERGELDLCALVQKTPEREALYEYSVLPLCMNNAVLVCRPESDYCLDDYAALDGARVGAVAGSAGNGQLERMLARYGCHVRLNAVYDETDLAAALRDGREDIVLLNADRSLEDCRIIARMPEVGSYVVAAKGDRSVMDDIDYALTQIAMNNPTLRGDLSERYRAGRGLSPSFTREEKAYIETLPPVRVLVSLPGAEILKNVDGDGTTSILQKLGALTGLRFEATLVSGASEARRRFQAGEFDMTFALAHDYAWADRYGAWLTDRYYEFPAQIVRRRDGQALSSVAALRGSYLEEAAAGRYARVVPCDTVGQALKLVREGGADAALIAEYLGDYYASLPRYSDLTFISDEKLYCAYAFGVSRGGDVRLVSILNKALNCIPDAAFDAFFTAYEEAPAASAEDLFYLNPTVFVAGAVLLSMLVFIVGALLYYANRFRRQNAALQRATNAKTDFLARMSHDLRMPLNAVMGIAELGRAEADRAPIRDYFAKIYDACGYQLGLVSDMLDMNAIESGKIKLRETVGETSVFFESVADVMRPLAQEKKVTLTHTCAAPPAPYVCADWLRLKQVYVNLLTNAVKFSPPGSAVLWSEQNARVESGFVRYDLVIEDHGCGMSEAFLARAFEPFEREANPYSQDFPGTGMGLAICKNIVRRMGGSIDVKSALGVGSTFTVHLAHAVASAPRAAAAPAVGPVACERLAGKRVLLAEDHALNREVETRSLKRMGLSVACAQNGQAALSLFAASPPYHFDAILMDMRMPVMDGPETAAAIRALDRPDAAGVPIIAMTANAFEEDDPPGGRREMCARLTKPVSYRELAETLMRVLAKQNQSKR